jgi:hypothetical protein
MPPDCRSKDRRLTMTTAVPPGAGGTPGCVIPDDDRADEDVDVRSLAGKPPPADGAWLWVTTAEGRHARAFTALAWRCPA